jgi:lysophospholipase L1-like esterase
MSNIRRRISGVSVRFPAAEVLLSLILLYAAVASAQSPIKIMPVGDSITYGYSSTGVTAYRRLLYLDLSDSGWSVDFVGNLENGSPNDFDRDHEGHPGWTAVNVGDYIYGWLEDQDGISDQEPVKIVALHIGTNDIENGRSAADVRSAVNHILDRIDQYEQDYGTDIIVLLARIINRNDILTGSPKSQITSQFNDLLNDLVAARSGDRVLIVDMEKGAGIDYRRDSSKPYTSGDLYDNFHPNDSGDQKMAAKWFGDGFLAILPQADAGGDQIVSEKTLVTLDGSLSVDPDEPAGGQLFYFWQQESGPEILISDPTAPKPTFTSPEVTASGDRLGFKLTVTDADGFEHSDTVFVDVDNVFVEPVANAGPDQIIPENKMVTLNGSGSQDPDGIISSVEWEQISGKAQVTLTVPTDLTTQFEAPEVDSDGDILTFKLTVSDNDDLVSSDTVTITVKNGEAPVAEAGTDQTVTAGDTVRLDGSRTMDPDGTILAVQWEQISGNTQAALTSPQELSTDFVAPEVGSEGDVQVFKLTVKDNDDLVSEDTVTVTISPPVTVSPTSVSSSEGGSGGGGCFIQAVIN